MTVPLGAVDETGDIGIHPGHQQIDALLLVGGRHLQKVSAMGGMLDSLLFCKLATGKFIINHGILPLYC